MIVTKFGQCCLLIEVAGKRILTDPGRFSSEQNELESIDIILITHEHPDHLHAESLEAVLAKNPEAEVITNTGVGKILEEMEVKYSKLEGRETADRDGLSLEAFDGQHVEIFEEYGQVQNTGYFINNELFYPGDAYTNPGKETPILALPVGGPWCKAADALKYAIEVNPTKAFPVHDAVMNEDGINLVHGLFEKILSEKKIDFKSLRNGEPREF